MSEAEGTARQAQNYAEIHFVTRDGDQIIEPLKIFRAVSQEYHIALPILNGYVLVNKPQQLTHIMGAQPASIDLVYGKIGSLHVYHGLTDMTGELIPLTNGDQPDDVAPVKLPDVDDAHHYYEMDDEGIGDQIRDTNTYRPAIPTAKTSIVSLTDSEKAKVDRMEHELSEGTNDSILSIDDLKSELERPDDEPAPSYENDSRMEQANQAVEQQDSDRHDLTNQAKENVGSQTEPSFMTTSQAVPTTEAEKPVTQATVRSQPESVQRESQTTGSRIESPEVLLAKALSLICQNLTDTDDKQKISGLTESAKQMLAAIKILTKLNND